MIPAKEALKRLQEGNKRFVSDVSTQNHELSDARRAILAEGQQPFAVILGCSDSRVPVELVFDQGFGDLFVIRVAGNIVAPSQIGSIEFAAQQFNTRLVVVLGHSRCGAILATLDEMKRPKESQSPNLKAIVDRIRPALEDLNAQDENRSELVTQAVRANIRAAVRDLKKGSPIIENLINSAGLMVIGAEYCLDSGTVEFFDEQ